MTHPVKECSQKLELTHRAFVVLYDISWERLRSCLYGYTNSIPSAILSVMIQNGYDEQEAGRQYLLWRKWRESARAKRPRATEGKANP
ncbi:preprotein translocase subunit TatA [Paenibacillus thiaminolyticus]|uniref:Preprotein translocase subunit TatA n=1 Tax=Paenibacillus thiaminolyticus TaxID=49283 RepID=A0A3A3GDS1_PANTH|nr:preprotein translocase subunit TatA [Paenibacillus thiaminolyticus]